MTQSNSERAGAFWSSALQHIDAPTPLMVDSIPDGRSSQQTISVEYSCQRKPGENDSVFWRAAFALLLGRYSNEDVVLFGHAGGDGVMPVIAKMEWDHPFAAWAESIEAWRVEADNQPKVDFLTLQQEFTAIPNGTPMLQATLVSAGAERPDVDSPLVIMLTDDGFRIDFDSGRLSESSVLRLASHLETLTESLIERPDSKLLDAVMLPAIEYKTVIADWNATDVDFPTDKCLHQLFEDRVAAQPDAVAVTFSGRSLTYRELNSRSNKIAHRLVALGVKPDTAVGISLRRGIDMVAAMMAIAKSGAGYLPLDPDYPADRLQFMVSDSDVSVLITQSDLLGVFSDAAAQKIILDSDAVSIESLPTSNPNCDVKPTDLAYLIYTSGSTGQPKGVMLDHRGRVNNFCDFNKRYSVACGDRLLGLSSISFDMCAYDVFGTLAAGAEIVVGESGGDLDPSAWADLLTRHKITVWHSVPALLEMVVDEVESAASRHPRDLRLVLLGGDWIPVTLPDRVKAIAADNIRVISMGGATEVSMDSTIFEIEETDSKWKSIPYGAPMWNQRAYVLDSMMRPVPIGVPGELYLGGIGVGRGYLNRPELNAEKFIGNPFIEGERLYRTGDLCRWREDGNLQILGRMDFQVKIRGFRIELGEIEAALRSHPNVHETVVMAKDGPSGDKRLAAYVIREIDDEDEKARDENASNTVDKWAAVFDAAYQVPGVGDADPTFKITSWDSSYTGEPYPDSDVREWVQTSVDRILDFKPKRVFEIGCGTGLLLFRIAPKCDTYVGIDTSQVAIDHVELHCKNLGYENVKVAKGDAANCDGHELASFDMVVINSVAQNFPNAAYFVKVVENAVRLLKPGGVLFLGDMRDKRAERELQSSISLLRAPDKWTGEEILAHADRQIDRQEELIVDPMFFAALADKYEEVSHVEVELRRGPCADEMTKFRYNVIVRVAGEPELPTVQATVEYDRKTIADLLAGSKHDCLEVRNIPNDRIFPEAEILKAMRTDSGAHLRAQLVGRLQDLQNDPEMISPHDFEVMAAELGYQCACRYAASGDRRYFDALLTRGEEKPQFLPFEMHHENRALSDYFNTPLDESKQSGLTPKLRHFLEGLLPHYMIPASYIYLDKFPLSPNGKVNRRALPEPDNVRPELDVEFVSPVDTLETVLVRIWTDGLGLDRVGTRDPFVAVGGSSLLATQLVSRVRDVFQIQVPLKECLNGHITDVKRSMLRLGAEQGIDVEEIADIYSQVLAMSDDEVQDQLLEQTE